MTAHLDLSATSPVPFTRLLVGIGLIVILMLGTATVITLVQSEPVLFGDFISIAAYMTSFLLPILAIMLVTSEWSQRTALVTFTLEPRRSRVVLAKLVVAQLLTLLTLVVSLGVGMVCTGDLRARAT